MQKIWSQCNWELHQEETLLNLRFLNTATKHQLFPQISTQIFWMSHRLKCGEYLQNSNQLPRTILGRHLLLIRHFPQLIQGTSPQGLRSKGQINSWGKIFKQMEMTDKVTRLCKVCSTSSSQITLVSLQKQVESRNSYRRCCLRILKNKGLRLKWAILRKSKMIMR